ncbi:MAG: hypothetical protein DMG87_12275 [Acidobacteria bacterium]|nr:MAG: hypothetical protein DMG87_12275 [Acidobacteriota bacterium]
MRHRSVTYSAEAAFQALADPTRRAVLELLRRGSQPAGQIARAFPVSRPAISKHLRLLRRAHLVQERKEGRHRFYTLNPEPLKAVDSWLEQYRVFLARQSGQLENFCGDRIRERISAQQEALNNEEHICQLPSSLRISTQSSVKSISPPRPSACFAP